MKIKQIFSDEHLVFQEGQSTCGPVTLLNVLHLKSDFDHTEDELAKLCDTKTGVGTSHERMVSAAKALGLEVIERHIDQGNFVIINYIHTFSGNGHYGLVSEYDDQAFYFRDCSLGFLRLRREYFEKYWYDEDRSSRAWFMAVK
jgi:predicted double-glycine peptidase